VTVRNYDQTSEDAYGSTRELSPESPFEVRAIPAPNAPTQYEAITGEASAYSMTFYIHPKDTEGMRGKNPSDDLRTEIDYNGTTFTINDIHTDHKAGVARITASD
jgi:hypothetical protein